VCVCVCERERELVSMCLCVCVCVMLEESQYTCAYVTMDSKPNHMHAFARSLFVCVVNLIVRA